MRDAISDFLGAATDIVATVDQKPKKTIKTVQKQITAHEKQLTDNLEEDYEYARDNIKKIIDENMGIMNELTTMAMQSQDPAWFDAASKFMKHVVEANDKLMQLSFRQLQPIQQHQNKKELATIANSSDNKENVNTTGQTTITNNTVFLGTTEDLFDSLQAAHNRMTSKVIN